MKRLTKIMLIGLGIIILVTTFKIFPLIDGGCGCADSYMGAQFIGSVCIFDEESGVMLERYCNYEY